MNVEEDFHVGSARLIMNGRCCQTQQPHGIEKSNKVNYTNRNSTGSTNSSQTSSGFESSKSASSHQLAQPCHSTPAHHQLQQQNESPQAFQISPNEDNSISSHPHVFHLLDHLQLLHKEDVLPLIFLFLMDLICLQRELGKLKVVL
uniref:Uncharacterized protein n=1 Tax=Meloidogyne enterolobii TaxID=390850 RepID=A0A6V7TUX6_MELEN|nr:unnamed protein product [Meloidogyne enterolobii]